MDRMQSLTYTFAAHLSLAAHIELDRLLAMHCQLYNSALEERRAAYSHSRQSLSFATQSRELTGLRADDPHWAAQDRRVAVETLRRLDRAYQRFYSNVASGIRVSDAGRPRFRSQRRFRTLAVYAGASHYLRCDKPTRYRLDIKGLPPIRFRARRLLQGQPLEIRVVRKARRVEVQLVYQTPLPTAPETSATGVGVHMGLTPRVATSDGLRVERRMIDHRRLKRLDRRMASMRLKAVASGRARWAPTGDGPARLEWEGGVPSVRYRDFRAQYGREWERITEADHQHCHRLTTAIIQSLDPGELVSVENPHIRQLLIYGRDASAVSEQRWGQMASMLEYKAARAGLRYETVTSERLEGCSRCGATLDVSTRGLVRCPECGLTMEKEQNTAINVLRRAISSSGALTRNVAENTPSNQNIGSPVAATDSDSGDTLTYSLGGTDATSFGVETSTGQLKTKAPLDHETKASYSLTVSVHDGKNRAGSPDTAVDATVTVTIIVTDMNEPPALLDTETGVRQIAENTVAGVNIGGRVAATDQDGDSLTYSLAGTDATSFEFDASNGQLKTKAPLDHETTASYTVTISVRDSRAADGTSDTATDDTITVTVSVIDLAEDGTIHAVVATAASEHPGHRDAIRPPDNVPHGGLGMGEVDEQDALDNHQYSHIGFLHPRGCRRG